MLERLQITNFVLFESASVEFGKGLTIISGESGAGKTALLESIALMLGSRADPSLIRQGEERAVVEGIFDVDPKEIAPHLEEGGICLSRDDPLIIRRELV